MPPAVALIEEPAPTIAPRTAEDRFLAAQYAPEELAGVRRRIAQALAVSPEAGAFVRKGAEVSAELRRVLNLDTAPGR